MPIIYIPSSAYGGNSQGNLPFAQHSGFTHPFHGTLGGLQAGIDPRNRGRIRSQAEIDASSRAAYLARQQHLDEIKRMRDERLAAEADAASHKSLQAQANRSRMAIANNPKAAANEMARQQTEAEDTAKREALAARGGKAVRLSPEEQKAAYDKRVLASQRYAGDQGPHASEDTISSKMSSAEPASTPVAYEAPVTADENTNIAPNASSQYEQVKREYNPPNSDYIPAYDAMSKYAAVDAERRRQLEEADRNIARAKGNVQLAEARSRDTTDRYVDSLRDQAANMPTGMFGNLPEYLSRKTPSDYLNAFGSMVNQGLGYAPEAIGHAARAAKDFVDSGISNGIGYISDQLGGVRDSIGEQLSKVKPAFNQAARDLEPQASDALDNLKTYGSLFMPDFERMGSEASSAYDSAGKAGNNAYNAINNAGNQLIDTAGRVPSEAGKAYDYVNNMWTTPPGTQPSGPAPSGIGANAQTIGSPTAPSRQYSETPGAPGADAARTTKDFFDQQLISLLQALQQNPPNPGRNPGSRGYMRR